MRLGRALAVIGASLVLTGCGAEPADDVAVPNADASQSTEAALQAGETPVGEDPAGVESQTTMAADVAPQQSPESGTTVEFEAPPATPLEAYEEDGEEQVVVVPEPPDPEDAVGRAIADLADRLGVDESAITLVSVDQVIWRDASLGCPEPGQAYAQVLTPGSRIVLSVSGATYEYHSGLGGNPFYCADPEPPAATT